MPDREKVIEHITDCVKIADCQINHNWVFVRTDILRDALALLKSQEPRVMTLEEVENALDTVVWVDRPTAKNESKLFGLIQAYSRKFKFIQIKHIEMNMGEHMLYPYETYGKEWRCWDKRPTDEQRKATSWQQ